MIKHFIELEEYGRIELGRMLDLAIEMKQQYRRGICAKTLAGKTMVMVFEKPSSRTRLSFQVAMTQLGGHAIYIRPEDIGGPLGQREPIKDLARILNGYVDVIVVRTFAHKAVRELASYSRVPVINALTDQDHPCQAMADMVTIREHFGSLAGRKLAYVGDGNNVARSLAAACVRLGLQFTIASPEGYALDPEFVRLITAGDDPGSIRSFVNPRDAVRDAEIVYTDTWTSMGQEDEKQKRIQIFESYQVNRQLLADAAPNVKVMHCLPAYRGLEITDEVIESPQSIIFDQAENRLHFQRALLQYLYQ
jgi:ornithine carbamoyltransferase